MKEEWKQHPVYTRYEVSTYGQVRRIGGKLLSPCVGIYGYIQHILSPGRINKKAHVLVLETFVGPRKGKVSRHLNGVKTDNRLKNLSWGSQKENAEDRTRHGKTYYGSANGNSKYTEAFVLQVRHLYQTGFTQTQIADMFGINQPRVSYMINGGWKHLSETLH